MKCKHRFGAREGVREPAFAEAVATRLNRVRKGLRVRRELKRRGQYQGERRREYRRSRKQATVQDYKGDDWERFS